MIYYKIYNDSYIGVATSADFCKYITKHNRFMYCDSAEAEAINVGGNFYTADWMGDTKNLESVNVVQITEEEYNELKSLEESGTEIEIQEPEITEEITKETVDTSTIEYIRAAKIRLLCNEANARIESGFDHYYNGATHHFSMSAQDQINLINAQNLILSGEEYIPYHADGEPFEYFPADLMSIIISLSIVYRSQIQAIYNALREYINTLNDKAEILAVTFDTEIPTDYISSPLGDIASGEYIPEVGLKNLTDIEDFLGAVLGEDDNELE